MDILENATKVAGVAQLDIANIMVINSNISRPALTIYIPYLLPIRLVGTDSYIPSDVRCSLAGNLLIKCNPIRYSCKYVVFVIPIKTTISIT